MFACISDVDPDVPAPNSYSLKEGITGKGPAKNTGPTLKSRHSPWVYSGLKTTIGI